MDVGPGKIEEPKYRRTKARRCGAYLSSVRTVVDNYSERLTAWRTTQHPMSEGLGANEGGRKRLNFYPKNAIMGVSG
jgi:hypothetical protein